MDELTINTRKGRFGTTILELSGQLGKDSAAEIENTLKSLERDGQVKIIVSCKSLDYLSSDASSVFLAHLIHIKKVGGDIRFCDVSAGTRSTLIATGLSKLLVIFESEAEALSDFSEEIVEESTEETAQPLVLEQEAFGDNIMVLSPVGSIDRHTIELLDETLSQILQSGRPRIVINGAKLTYISSNGMGVFIGFLSKVRAKQGDLRFFALNDIVRTVITTLGLHRLFRLFEDRQQAIDSFADVQT